MARPKSWTLLGESARMAELRKTLERYARTPFDVLITGPRGAGKELAAREIHDRSARKSGPFIAVDCGALPESLIESELFGHEAGSFTGASAERPGLIEMAHDGTLLLDEIGNLALGAQAGLLRFLEDRRVRRVGGRAWRPVDVRILAATNHELERSIREKAFLPDLYDRLNVLRVEMPPLDDHREDIPTLAATFLRRISAELRRDLSLNDEALVWLKRRAYPGNVRELRNLLCRAAALAESDSLTLEELAEGDPQLPPRITGAASGSGVAH